MEDEKHFIIDCDFYDQERNGLSLWFLTVKNKDFNQLDLNKKREILLNLILHVSTCSSSSEFLYKHMTGLFKFIYHLDTPS